MFQCIVQPRHDWGPLDLAAAHPDIRMQLCEQSRVLEARAEASAGVATELHEYCRRRAELEHEYSRALDKLARAATQRHKDQKHKRENWQYCGAAACWQQALDGTRALAKDHAALADLYGGVLAAKLQRAADDALRLHRKCRDIVVERQEELGQALAEAGAAGKACAAAATEWRAAAVKLRHAHDQRERLAAADPPRPKKLKALDKELEKRRARHAEARARGLRARADYVLSLEAANATLQRYYLDDIAEIMMCMEVGFEAVVGRAVRTAAAAEAARAAHAAAAAGALQAAADALDALQDRQRFLDAHQAPFTPPNVAPLTQGVPAERQDAELVELAGAAAPDAELARAAAADELRQRLQQLETGARQLRAEVRESAKTLDAAEAELVRLLAAEGWDAGAGDEAARRDQEDYFLSKFRAYVACAGRLARIEGRTLGARARVPGTPPPSSPPAARPRARALRAQFAAPLGDRLPRVLTSCVRVIALYGARHQGIFRVSGSQLETLALRAAFERGQDPLALVADANDINSVCGLLKLYLRSLRPPLLPPALQPALLRAAAECDDVEFVRAVRSTLAALATPALLVLRYLFAFLSYLTQYSTQNMMDAWNLAICLGPTLLSACGEGGGGGQGGAQVAAQNLANELVKRLIVHHADVFPQDIAPHALFSPPAEPAGPDAADAPDRAGPDRDDHDVNEDLSLYDDDDDDDDGDDDEISEDGESGEWQESNNTENHTASSVERRQPSVSSQSQAPAPARLAESTPDLVLDLPARGPAPPPSPSPSPSPASAPCASPAPAEPPAPAAPESDTADNFVHNRDTLRKRSRPSSEQPGPAPAPAASPAGSPVPARNTARVAAKFAELTLTGGSLKPALAAKPALLRRPTPHPAHARPAPERARSPSPAAAAPPEPEPSG
ncbi:SLIT-ROBO Rho GTPase-activating protein 1-like isoform X2 [Plodia interpunctella]|uniref:SLIT-ROBO Rho GTPase-activating protein 1-like isoform X2 n=1 Tax=Plodia interpunctella TaxID=58824 RepID=UPI0023676D87|nr:SLIT-ROBO Rho GTPase-activating protein 1-like isoform X2 [Plodia interpunctella]